MLWRREMDVFKLEETLRTYLLKNLLPRLGVDKTNCRITNVLSGVKTIVRIVEPIEESAGFDGAVLRLYPIREKSRAEKNARISSFLISSSVSVPQLIDFCTEYKKDGVIILAEKCIKGKSGVELGFTPPLAAKLAQTLRGLHLIREAAAELKFDFEVPGYAAQMQKRVHQRLKGLKKFIPAEKDEKKYLPQITKWLNGWRERLLQLNQLGLIHDKLHLGNIIFSEKEQRFYLIDVETVQPGSCLKDLMQIYHEALSEKLELLSAFNQAYFEGEPKPISSETLKALTPFFDAYYHLAESAINWRRHFYHLKREKEKGENTQESSFSRNARVHFEELLKIIIG